MPTFDNDTSYSSIVIDSVISAITLVIALAWNKAIKELIVKITYLDSYGVILYAVLVTLIGVFTIRTLLSFNKRLGNFK